MYNFVCVGLAKRVVLITLVSEIWRHRNDRYYYDYYLLLLLLLLLSINSEEAIKGEGN